jgi:hypothetical protein
MLLLGGLRRQTGRLHVEVWMGGWPTSLDPGALSMPGDLQHGPPACLPVSRCPWPAPAGCRAQN